MFKTILASVDLGDPEAEAQTVAAGVAHARAFNAALHIMTVVPDYGFSIIADILPKNHEAEAREHARQLLEDYVAQHVPADITPHLYIGHGSIYRQILFRAGEVDAELIILSAGRDSRDDYHIGPNAARVARYAGTSVLIVRNGSAPDQG